MDESFRSRGLSITLSCVLHLGLAIGLILGQQWVTVAVAVRPPVLPVQLVTLDRQEELEREPPAPPAPAPRRRIRPPRLVEPSRPPDPPAVKAEEPPPPMPAAPTPVSAPADPAPVDTPPPARASESAAVLAPPISSPAPRLGPSVPSSTPAAPVTTAAPPTAASDGLTQYARPQGGYQVRPAYPAGPRRLGIQGTTLLRVHVLADGRIGEVVVEKSAGHQELDDAAAGAVQRWRFEPARRGTEAVAMWVLLPVEFRLR